MKRMAEHTRSHPTALGSTGAFRFAAPFPLWISNIPSFHLMSLGASLTTSETRRPARHVISRAVAAAQNDEAVVKAVMKGVQTEAKPLSACLSPKTSWNREVFDVQARTSRAQFVAATPSPVTRPSGRFALVWLSDSAREAASHRRLGTL
jgi:hypothetical protein